MGSRGVASKMAAIGSAAIGSAIGHWPEIRLGRGTLPALPSAFGRRMKTLSMGSHSSVETMENIDLLYHGLTVFNRCSILYKRCPAREKTCESQLANCLPAENLYPPATGPARSTAGPTAPLGVKKCSGNVVISTLKGPAFSACFNLHTQAAGSLLHFFPHATITSSLEVNQGFAEHFLPQQVQGTSIKQR